MVRCGRGFRSPARWLRACAILFGLVCYVVASRAAWGAPPEPADERLAAEAPLLGLGLGANNSIYNDRVGVFSLFATVRLHPRVDLFVERAWDTGGVLPSLIFAGGDGTDRRWGLLDGRWFADRERTWHLGGGAASGRIFQWTGDQEHREPVADARFHAAFLSAGWQRGNAVFLTVGLRLGHTRVFDEHVYRPADYDSQALGTTRRFSHYYLGFGLHLF